MSQRVLKKNDVDKVKTPDGKSEDTKDKTKSKTVNSKERARPPASNRRPTKTAPKKSIARSANKEKKEEEGFEVVEFLLKHFKITNWNDFHGLTYEPKEVHNILDLAIAALQKDAQLVKISAPVTIVGDISGSFPDLIRVLNVKGAACPSEIRYPFIGERYVFLGDYTEISDYNLETICLLFALKVIYEKRYILLRGHQESHQGVSKSQFRDQIHKKFAKEGPAIWAKFERAFCEMPLAALVGGKILCVHGGISNLMNNSLEPIEQLPKSSSMSFVPPLMNDVLFSAPLTENITGAENGEIVYYDHDELLHSKMYNAPAVEKFCHVTGVQLIVRGHDVPLNGFQFFALQKVVTIFSTPMFNGYGNKAAILKVDGSGRVTVIQMRASGGFLEKEKKKDKDKDKEKKDQAPPPKTIPESKEKVPTSKRRTPMKGESPDKASKEDSLYDNISERPLFKPP